jgi:uncharacterized membrane protein
MPLGWEIYLDIMRYLHIAAGIIWIGLLYYFNLVQVPAFAKMEPDPRRHAIMILVPQALLWFRYAALATVAFGLLYVLGIGINEGEDYFTGFRFRAVAIGMTFGIIMAFNVWAIIWPNQKKIIAATTATVRDGTPAPPEQPKWARRAFLASRTNTMLSIPMLFFMVAAIHLPSLWQ